MSKQVAVVIAPGGSVLKKVMWLAIGLGVLIYVWQSPADAASFVRTVFTGVVTFIRSL